MDGTTKAAVAIVAAMSVIIAAVLVFMFVQQQNDRHRLSEAAKEAALNLEWAGRGPGSPLLNCVLAGTPADQCPKPPPGTPFVEPEAPPGWTPPAKP